MQHLGRFGAMKALPRKNEEILEQSVIPADSTEVSAAPRSAHSLVALTKSYLFNSKGGFINAKRVARQTPWSLVHLQRLMHVLKRGDCSEAETSNSPLELLEKGISNLTELMAELQQSHAPWPNVCRSYHIRFYGDVKKKSLHSVFLSILISLLWDKRPFHKLVSACKATVLENMKTKVVQERVLTAQRGHRLKALLEEFKSRVIRAQRGIGRLRSFIGTALCLISFYLVL